MLRLIEDGKPEYFFKDTDYYLFGQEKKTIFSMLNLAAAYDNPKD